MSRVLGWLLVAVCCGLVAALVPGIVGDVAPVFAGGALLLAGREALS